MRRKRHSRVGTLLVAASLAAGCGGGGGSDGPPAPNPPGAATLSLEIGLKQLRFTWVAVNGATSYRLLANPDGSSGFTQVGANLTASDTNVDLDVAVHLHDWAHARYMLDACNASGCTGSSAVGTIGGALDAIGYFKTSNHEAGDRVDAVAISADGETLVIGARSEDSAATGIDGNPFNNSAASAGAAYIFRRDASGAWSQRAYVKASNTESLDSFGDAVALSADGDTLAVGATGEASAASGVGGNQADNSMPASGAIYVFVRDGAGSWTQQAYVKASNPDPGDSFGSEVALSGDGDTLAVSARSEGSAATGIDGDQSDNSAGHAGAVYVFHRDGSGNWSQQAYVKASNAEQSDDFGAELALDFGGDTLAVGAAAEGSAATGIDGNQSDNSAPASGAAYVFHRDPSGDWSQQAYVKPPNTEAFDEFRTVRLSDDGNTLAVGAAAEDSGATGVGGNQADNGVPDSGAVYVYARSGTTWSFLTYIKPSNTDFDDQFGFSVALSGDGNTIAVSAIREDSGSSGVDGDQTDNNVDAAGAVYVFRRDSSADPWTQRAYIKASNPDDGDFFGAELGLSADGSTLAALSPTEESAATGIGGNQDDNTAPLAGAVWLY